MKKKLSLIEYIGFGVAIFCILMFIFCILYLIIDYSKEDYNKEIYDNKVPQIIEDENDSSLNYAFCLQISCIEGMIYRNWSIEEVMLCRDNCYRYWIEEAGKT